LDLVVVVRLRAASVDRLRRTVASIRTSVSTVDTTQPSRPSSTFSRMPSASGTSTAHE
jgi:hypothetical protein